MVRKYLLRQKVHAPMIILARSTAAPSAEGSRWRLEQQSPAPIARSFLFRPSVTASISFQPFGVLPRDKAGFVPTFLKKNAAAGLGLWMAAFHEGTPDTHI